MRRKWVPAEELTAIAAELEPDPSLAAELYALRDGDRPVDPWDRANADHP